MFGQYPINILKKIFFHLRCVKPEIDIMVMYIANTVHLQLIF